MPLRRRRLAVLLVSVLLACASGNDSRPATGDDAGSIVINLPDALDTCRNSATAPMPVDGGAIDPLCATSAPAVSFAIDALPILKVCTGDVCHAPWKYDTLAGQRSTLCCDRRWLVEPGQPSVSHLVEALQGSSAACVAQMPLNEGSLATPDIATITAWVCQGALDN